MSSKTIEMSLVDCIAQASKWYTMQASAANNGNEWLASKCEGMGDLFARAAVYALDNGRRVDVEYRDGVAVGFKALQSERAIQEGA